jgi:hypothetical protein
MSLSPFDPLGFRLDGRPFWGFSGAEGEDDGGGDDSDSDDDADVDDDKEPAKPAKSTLQKVIDERKAVRDEYRPWKAALRELGIDSPDKLKDLLTKGAAGASGTGTQNQVDLDKVREDARAEVRLESNRDLALAKVEAAAKGMFADPDDAVSFLKNRVDDLLGRDGKPDKSAIKSELDELLAAKPHWGVGKQEDMTFDGGVRTPATAPKTMDGFLRQESARKRGH